MKRREKDSEILVLGELLEEKAKKNRDKTFLYFNDQEISYEKINEISNKMANGFFKIGVKKGDNVCIMLPNCPEFLYSWFGLARIGAVEVTVNTALKGDFLHYIIENCDAEIMVIDDQFLDRLVFIQDRLEKLKKIVIRRNKTEDRIPEVNFEVIDYKELLENPPTSPHVQVEPRDIEAIIYTSGTTGNPKGVMMAQGYFYQLAKDNIKARKLTSGDIVYTALPLFHGNAQGLTTLPCLIADAQMVLAERFSASGFWDDIRKYKATQFNYIGALSTFIYKQPAKDNDADNPVKIAFGAAMPREIIEGFEKRFNLKVLEGFGLTESGMVAYNPLDAPRSGSFGKPTEGYEVKIVDDDGYEVPPGTVGEIVSRPKKPYFMMSGYYRMPENTLEVFKDLWFHTGDYGKMDEDGYFYFVDRKKDYLRVKGENISSFEVEKAINSHPSILESAVIGVHSDSGEDEMKICLVLKPGEGMQPEEFMSFCEKVLPYYMIPRYVEFREFLPKTPTERVEKYKLRQEGVTPDTWDREKEGYKLKK